MNELYDDERALITRALQALAADAARTQEAARLIGDTRALGFALRDYNAALGLSDKLERARDLVLTY